MSAFSLFYKSIEAVLHNWTALQLAVAHSSGGAQSREKAEWLVGATEQWLTENNDVDSLELEEFLEDVMSSEFNAIVDDGSLAEVASKICQFCGWFKNSQLEKLNAAVDKLPKGSVLTSSQPGEGDSDDDLSMDDSNMMNHMNALELSKDTEKPAHSADSNSSNLEENGVAKVDAEQMEEDDGWTTVTKGKKKRGG
ncbi:pre-rRNA-processing protein TSR2 homolog [Watersipora subatra]|uniref:pre-rRNA-processing protein TSR2 homolog n=1 Tax=Watersipora subatra TaxID=2589382 RepID=UPI00355B3AA2